MNYTKIYTQLIERAQLREMPNEYCEKHHIVPRCFYGSDDKRNLATLTLREHFIAHRLLAKIHPWHKGLLQAVASFMQNNNRLRILTSRQFEIARKAARDANTGKELSFEHKEAISAANKNREFTQTHKSALSAALTGQNNPMHGKTHSEEAILLIKTAKLGENNPFYGKHHTDQAKKAMSVKLSGQKSPFWGKKRSQESINKQKATRAQNRPINPLPNLAHCLDR